MTPETAACALCLQQRTASQPAPQDHPLFAHLKLAPICSRMNSKFDAKVWRQARASDRASVGPKWAHIARYASKQQSAANGKNRCPSVSILGPGKRCTDRGWARLALNHRCRRSRSPVNRRNLESNVQSLDRTRWPYLRLVLASARAYTTSLGDSLRNVQSLLSKSGVQPSLRSAQRTV